MLSDDNQKKFERLKQQFPSAKSLTLPLLWMLQEQYGWISEERMKFAADLLGLPVRHVFGVVTFYTMFNIRPVGQYQLQVCTNVSCMLKGSDELLDHVCQKLDVKLHETTSDSKFTVTNVECLGSCGTAPMMQVNNREYYENLTADKVDQLLDRWSKS